MKHVNITSSYYILVTYKNSSNLLHKYNYKFEQLRQYEVDAHVIYELLDWIWKNEPDDGKK